MLYLLLLLVSTQSISSKKIFPLDLVHWNQAVESVKTVLDANGVEYYGRQSSCATYEIVAYQKNPIGSTDTVTYSFYISDYKIKVDNPKFPNVRGLYEISVKIKNPEFNLEAGSDKKIVRQYLETFKISGSCHPNDDNTGFRSCVEKESTTWSIYTNIGEQINVRVPMKYDARYASTKVSFRQAATFRNLETAKQMCEDELITAGIR